MKEKIEKPMTDEQLEKTVLDAYFSIRHPTMQEAPEGTALDFKNTQDIIDDLRNIIFLSEESVVRYLVEHAYQLKPAIDGTLRWEIYREPVADYL